MSVASRAPRAAWSCIRIGLALALTCAPHANAGEEPEHRYLIYALALGAGFSPEDSRTLADASWSQDTNQATTAFSGMRDARTALAEAALLTRDPERIRNLMQDDDAIDAELIDPDGIYRRNASSALLHALVSDPRRLRSSDPDARKDDTYRPEDAYIRPTLDASYHRFLRTQQQALREDGAARETVHMAGLLIAGQYLHQFVDAYPHPEDAVVGHAARGHIPDQAWADPERFKASAFWTLRELKILRGTLETTDERGALFSLSNDSEMRSFSSDVVDALVSGYGSGKSLRRLPILRTLSLPLNYTDSDLTDDDRKRFDEKLAKALNDSPLRRHPTYKIAVPPYTKVGYELGEDGRMTISYGRMQQTLELDDFVQWLHDDPQFDDVWLALRASIRAYIRNYPEWAAERLEALREAIQALDTRIRDTKHSVEMFKQGRAQSDQVREAMRLPIPTRDLNQERVAARKAAAERAAREREEAQAEAAAERRRQERAKRETVTPRSERPSTVDHDEARRRICRGVGVLCD